MPIKLDGAYPPVMRVQVGDVLIVSKRLRDKQTDKLYWWRFFAVVETVYGHRRADVIRIGAEKGKDELTVSLTSIDDQDFKVEYLPMEEWPDGVHAFRMKLILEGRIEEIV